MCALRGYFRRGTHATMATVMKVGDPYALALRNQISV